MHRNASYESLFDFGFSFLGPILTAYFSELNEKRNIYLPVCLAREGYLFDRVIKKAKSEGYMHSALPPVYLKVSRTFLFKILADDPWCRGIALSKGYGGNFLDLLLKRFAIQLHEAMEIFPMEILLSEIVLPSDKDKVESFFSSYQDKINRLISAPKKLYLNYLSETLEKPANAELAFLDVGYAATIQKLLSYIIKADTHGYYFVTTESGCTSIEQAVVEVNGVLLEGAVWGQKKPLLDKSLFLECLLTAPHGQVIDIRERATGEVEFIFGRKTKSQVDFHELSAIHDGAAQAVLENLKNKVTYSADEVSLIYSTYVNCVENIPLNLRAIFSIDDDVSGNGIINPLSFLQV